MSSIFRKDDNYVDKPKRNTFDMSSQNNLTLNFGKLYPVMVQPVMPGDSVRIRPSFGLRFMPQKFPVQTRQRASVKYYYVRNRNLWKDWPDFIGKTKSDLTPPYINFGDNISRFYHLRPSGLCDYMGVPIKIDRTIGDKEFHLESVLTNYGTDYTYIPSSNVVYSNVANEAFAVYTKNNIDKVIAPVYMSPTGSSTLQLVPTYLDYVYGGTSESSDILPRPESVLDGTTVGIYPHVLCAMFRKAWTVDFPLKIRMGSVAYDSDAAAYLVVRTESGKDVAVPFTSVAAGQVEVELVYPKLDVYLHPEPGAEVSETIKSVVGIIIGSLNPVSSDSGYASIIEQDIRVSVNSNDGMLCWCDVRGDECPFYNNENTDGLRISALPFRAVESIYNAHIRNSENNPFMINGKPEYNKYIVSDEGGSQFIWKIGENYYCNWADDRFTTALPSPQQGNAPLVGLTGVNGATVTLGNEDGTQSTVHLQVDSDTGNVVMVDGISSDAPEYLNDAMMSAVEYGITINDLRNVNSYQRWLENNIRRGYKYKDQMMSHYGVNVRYDVLDMPEFIGGVSRDVSVNQITQTVKNEYGELGEFGGQSSIFGEGKSIEHYCDEHGYIIGLMCVYPMPLYMDTLPKHLIYNDAFDYYFPEFSKIGMQPITNKELAFSQSVLEGTMDDVFGYQRAWYDSLENLDEVHGAFRFELRNFLLGRDFGSMPKLNKDFLTINADDINNTFYSDDDEDKIIGQIYHDMSMKRPIPVVGIPSLE